MKSDRFSRYCSGTYGIRAYRHPSQGQFSQEHIIWYVAAATEHPYLALRRTSSNLQFHQLRKGPSYPFKVHHIVKSKTRSKDYHIIPMEWDGDIG